MSATARTTGWAAIGYAVLYVLTFVTNALISTLGPASDVDYRTPVQMMADRPYAVVGTICFALLGAALIVVAHGLRRLIWGEESIIGAAASGVGVIAGAGFMLAGAALMAQRGPAANDLAGTGADAATQLAIVQGGFLLTNAGVFLASLALLIWLSSVAVAVSGDWDRAISDRSQPFYISGTTFTYHIPFEGDEEFLLPQPIFDDNDLAGGHRA